MSAQPAEAHEDPLDPQRILRDLPDRERANFLAAYREALDGARDPAGQLTAPEAVGVYAASCIDLDTPRRLVHIRSTRTDIDGLTFHTLECM